MGLFDFFKPKQKSPMLISTPKSYEITRQMNPNIKKIMEHFFHNYYDTEKHYQVIGDSFIIEMYIYLVGDFPETNNRNEIIKMVTDMQKPYIEGNPITSYEFVTYKVLNHNEVLVGTKRYSKSGSVTTLHYVLKNYGDNWIVENRVLFSGGYVADKIVLDDHIRYLIEEDDKDGAYYSLHFDYRRDTEINIGDTVSILCYYNTEGTLNGKLVTNIATIEKV